MKRSFEDIRNILLAIESSDYPCCWNVYVIPAERCIGGFPVEGVGDESLKYHIPLLIHAGLLSVEDVSQTSTDTFYRGVTISWAGHDFLDDIRTEGVWKKVRAALANGQLQTASFGVVAALAKDIIKRNLGIDQ